MHPMNHNGSSPAAAKKTWTEPVIHKIELNTARVKGGVTADGQGASKS